MDNAAWRRKDVHKRQYGNGIEGRNGKFCDENNYAWGKITKKEKKRKCNCIWHKIKWDLSNTKEKFGKELVKKVISQVEEECDGIMEETEEVTRIG